MSPYQPAPTDLPGILRQLGPGLIISAAIVGSGELIVTTKLGAEVGFRLLWFIIIGCLLKVFLQVELGRYAITHGQTTLDAMDSMPGPRWKVSWLVWVWLVMFIATFFQLAGIVGGIAGVFQVGSVGTGLPDWMWALLITGSCAVLLAIGRYLFIERFSTVLVALFTLFTIFAVGALYWTDYAITGANLMEGLSFKMPEDFTTAFVAFGIIGVGASELIYYPYWCLEKGYARHTGPNDNSPEWRERAKGWLRILRIDAWVSMVIYTLATIAFYLLGAAVLNAKQLEVGDVELIETLSHMYRETFGEFGFWIFLIGALVVLYSTVFIATASNIRLCVDLFQKFKWVHVDDEGRRNQLIRYTSVGLPGLYFIFYVTIGAPVSLVFVGGLAQALMLPFLAAAAIYFLHTKTEPALMPGTAWRVFLWISGILMAVVGSYQLITNIYRKFGGG